MIRAGTIISRNVVFFSKSRLMQQRIRKTAPARSANQTKPPTQPRQRPAAGPDQLTVQNGDRTKSCSRECEFAGGQIPPICFGSGENFFTPFRGHLPQRLSAEALFKLVFVVHLISS